MKVRDSSRSTVGWTDKRAPCSLSLPFIGIREREREREIKRERERARESERERERARERERERARESGRESPRARARERERERESLTRVQSIGFSEISVYTKLNQLNAAFPRSR